MDNEERKLRRKLYTAVHKMLARDPVFFQLKEKLEQNGGRITGIIMDLEFKITHPVVIDTSPQIEPQTDEEFMQSLGIRLPQDLPL